MVPFEAGESVSAKVVLAKPDANWAVASTTDGRLLVVQVSHHALTMPAACRQLHGVVLPVVWGDGHVGA